MIHAQHYLNEELAKRLVEDFPGAKFMHTIRDPITSIDSWFDRKLEMELFGCNNRIDLLPRYLDLAVGSMLDLLAWDSGHKAMSDRTRAIRFEDMHAAAEPTMRKVANWLDIAYEPSLIESTWNGSPYVVMIRGVATCGANPANARRRSRNLSFSDCLLIFAFLHDNFVAWEYPYPKSVNRRWFRLAIILLLWIVPMKMEAITARMILLGQALPRLRRRQIGFALGAPFYIIKRRIRMMLLIARETRCRFSGRHEVMKLV
jgi:hypothetical protein